MGKGGNFASFMYYSNPPYALTKLWEIKECDTLKRNLQSILAKVLRYMFEFLLETFVGKKLSRNNHSKKWIFSKRNPYWTFGKLYFKFQTCHWQKGCHAVCFLFVEPPFLLTEKYVFQDDLSFKNINEKQNNSRAKMRNIFLCKYLLNNHCWTGLGWSGLATSGRMG